MKLRHLLGAALALTLSTCCLAPAMAQSNSYKTLSGATVPGYVKMCPTGAIGSDGSQIAVPCQLWQDQHTLTDGQNAVGVAPPNAQPDKSKGAAVISISPNSGAPQQYPAGATPITGNGTGSTGAVVGTLAALPGRRTYICGFDVSGIGGTAALGPVTVAGLVGSSMVYQLSSAAAGITLSRTFTPCIPASADNTAITITTTADGTATAVDVNSWGFQQ